MKKITVPLPSITEILTKSRKPAIKKSKIIPPKKGGPYNRLKNKSLLKDHH